MGSSLRVRIRAAPELGALCGVRHTFLSGDETFSVAQNKTLLSDSIEDDETLKLDEESAVQKTPDGVVAF